MSGTVALFGGTFDPPHIGHVLSVAWALSAGGVERVLVMPAFEHPLGKEPTATFEQRVAMTELAMAPLRGAEVSRIEESLGGVSLTLRTIEAIHAQLPGTPLRLLVGADVLASTDRWHRWDRITELAPPLVVGRAGYPSLPYAPTLPAVSSTELRARLAAGERVDGELPSAVLDYATEQRIYQGGAG